MSENQTCAPSVEVKRSWWPAWATFSTQFEQWTRVINPIYIVYMLANAGVYFYAGLTLGDEYAFQASIAYLLVAGLFWVWQDSVSHYRDLLSSCFKIFDAYHDENRALMNRLADTSSKLVVAENKLREAGLSPAIETESEIGR